MNIYDLNFTTADGRLISFNVFKGKVCLIVNIASECGFTPQMYALQTIYLYYAPRGFEILAFPSNDFGKQEPMNDAEIYCHCTKEFGSTFQIFQKSHVVGKNTNSVFEYLSKKKLNHKWNGRPWWNFQKYLISKNGDLVNFWLPFVKPSSARLCRSIEAELSKNR